MTIDNTFSWPGYHPEEAVHRLIAAYLTIDIQQNIKETRALLRIFCVSIQSMFRSRKNSRMRSICQKKYRCLYLKARYFLGRNTFRHS